MPLPETLLERDEALARIDDVLAADAGMVVIAAPAGMGKSALLDATIARSTRRALVARASELESGFAFGVARQLLEGAVLAADEDARAELLSGAARRGAAALDLDPDADLDRDVHATIHGLYWLLVNLSAGGRLLIAVDDLQWVDDASLRWLAYAARRLEGLPIVLVIAMRDEPGVAASDMRRAATQELLDAAVRVEPAALSIGAVGELLSRVLGRPADASFAQACHTQTSGNPFLLSELAGELAAADLAPSAANASRLREIVPERIGDVVARQLARTGDDARALAAALAVLGAQPELALAAELADLDIARATAAAAQLVAAQILADSHAPRFRHPLLHAAVQAHTPSFERAALHARAAHLLEHRGAAAGLIGTHLLASPAGGGEAWAVEQLRAAARSARRQGLADAAAALLRRALAEPPPDDVRGAVLRELGEAELAALEPGAAANLHAARELTTDPKARADLAVAIGFAEYHAGNHVAGVDVLMETIEEIRCDAALREDWLSLEALLALIGRYDLETEKRTRGRIHELAATLAGETPAERLVRATAALERPGPTADDLYRATLDGERAERDSPWRYATASIGTIAMFLHAGRPDVAAQTVESLLAETRATGSPLRHAIVISGRALVALDVGDLRAARADAEAAFATLRELAEPAITLPMTAWRVLILAAMGDHELADEVLAQHELTGPVPEQMVFNPLVFARGTLRMEQRRFEEAEQDFSDLGRRHERWGITRPVPPWRSAAALALIAMGDVATARSLATAELELARAWDTPKSIAIATRALALTAEGEEAIAGLSEAVALLEDTPWRLDRARARADLGAALRRAGRRREARETLTLAMDEAHACGADPLAEFAAAELRISGARPRRRAVTGRDALTASELRVAQLAATGNTNREIAQELFVTIATVETHLRRVYRKLDIPGRAGLAAALEP